MGAVKRGLARVPLAAAALGCFAGIGSAELGWPSLWALLLLVPMGAAMVRRRGLLAAGFVLWALLWAVHAPRLATQESARGFVEDGYRGGLVELEGTLLSLRDRGGVLPRGLLRVRNSTRGARALRGAVLGLRQVPEEAQPGDRLLLTGILKLPGRARNPGEFDRREWLDSRGMSAEFDAYRVERSGASSPWLAIHRVAWGLRLQVRERIVDGLDPESASASVIRGLVLGDRSSGDAELFGVFRKSGTMHVFAVSGLHVGLVGALAWGLMWLLRVPRTWGLWLVLMIMWSYAFITGLRPPALRASFMASVLLVGFAAKRQPSLANSLLASLAPVLLLDSFQVGQAGFQLSYAVVGMIILVAPFLYRRVQPWVEGDSFLPRVLYTRAQTWKLSLRQKVAGLLVVSGAAWMGSLPLIAMHFGMVTPSAVFASVLLVPLAFLILSLALVGVGAGLISEPLGETANRANGLLAMGAYEVAKGFAALPGSHFELRGRGGWPDGLLVFDLWSGDGSVYCGAGDGLLIDAGDDDQYFRVIAPALREAGRGPASLALTHPDGGHAGGLPPALARYGSRQLLLPVREAGSPAFQELVAKAEAAGCRIHHGEEGERYPLGDGAELEIVRRAGPDDGSRADDRGLVMRLHWHGWRILLTGDAGFETEKELLARRADLRSEIWIMGRHESDYTGTMEFVEAVSPRVIVASEASYPLEERVPGWWAEAIAERGIDLWRQGETGAVMVEVAEGELALRSFLDAGKRRSLKKEETKVGRSKVESQGG